MRDLKFRAWNKAEKRMGTVLDISFHDGGIFFIVDYGNGELFLENEDSVVLMQYIGLKDASGKEIYEGDIVVCHAENWDYIGVVEYDETYDTGSYVLARTRKSNNEIVDLIMPRFTGDTKEVIGNLYENPELLEVEDGD